MAKKITTISIDEDILKAGKKEIPNFSKFIENCIRAYLKEYNVPDIENELNKIREASLNIYILTSKNKEQEFTVKRDKETENRAWIKVWGTYRSNETYNQSDLENAGKTLHMTGDSLLSLMNYLKTYCSNEDLRKCDDWDYAVKLHEHMLHEDDLTIDY